MRATALLAVSREWWEAPGALTLTYESLVANPVAEMERIVQAVGTPARRPVAEVVASATLPKMRAANRGRHHFWQGQARHWKRLLVAAVADAVARAQANAFPPFSYACDPDRCLT